MKVTSISKQSSNRYLRFSKLEKAFEVNDVILFDFMRLREVWYGRQ